MKVINGEPVDFAPGATMAGEFLQYGPLIPPLCPSDLPLELLLSEQDIETLPEVEQE